MTFWQHDVHVLSSRRPKVSISSNHVVPINRARVATPQGLGLFLRPSPEVIVVEAAAPATGPRPRRSAPASTSPTCRHFSGRLARLVAQQLARYQHQERGRVLPTSPRPCLAHPPMS